MEIKVSLVQMLQKKLDEATLDVIAITLRRNPMCKLMLEDVQVLLSDNNRVCTCLTRT